jgi:hypothetical protein
MPTTDGGWGQTALQRVGGWGQTALQRVGGWDRPPYNVLADGTGRSTKTRNTKTQRREQSSFEFFSINDAEKVASDSGTDTR